MTGFPTDRREIAAAVLQSFLSAGFSPAQARALTAEINRENSFRPDLLFGSHSDPHNRATNVGMLSWQGGRAPRLMAFLRERGQLDEQGRIRRTPEALAAQAQYLRHEMETDPAYARTREAFLGNPNIGYDDAHAVLGDNFIRWRRNDPEYRGSGYGRIDEGYRLLGDNPGQRAPGNPPAQPGRQPNALAAQAAPDPALNALALRERFMRHQPMDPAAFMARPPPTNALAQQPAFQPRYLTRA